MENLNHVNHFDPREERYAKEEYQLRSESYKKRPWHLQGWVWMIVALLSISALVVALVALGDQIAQVNGSIREQTAEIHRQSTILSSLSEGLNRIAQAITYGVDRILAAMHQ